MKTFPGTPKLKVSVWTATSGHNNPTHSADESGAAQNSVRLLDTAPFVFWILTIPRSHINADLISIKETESDVNNHCHNYLVEASANKCYFTIFLCPVLSEKNVYMIVIVSLLSMTKGQ